MLPLNQSPGRGNEWRDMSNTTKDAFRLVERELVKFGSYENAKKLLSKYMIGSSYDEEMVEKVLVILTTEFRHVIEKLSSVLPEDDTEAAAVVSRRASSKPRTRVKKDDSSDVEIIEDTDILNSIND